MFTTDFGNEESGVKPVKVWLRGAEDVEESALKQIKNLSRLPFVHKHVAIMPDVHSGYGMPIGGVIAAKGVIIPNAVGVDIGCGMSFMMTDTASEVYENETAGSGKLKNAVVGDIMRSVPVGFNHLQKDAFMPDDLKAREHDLKVLSEKNGYMNLFNACFPAAYRQAGTLGGGNHFMEIQKDEATGKTGVMIHSGSRNVGKQVCDHFRAAAKDLNEKYHADVPKEWDLAFLPIDSMEGKMYISYMDYCLDFAKQNRDNMMASIREILSKYKVLGKETMHINVHHNYASLENHYGENVWVHRKGAVRAREGELVIIPGSMGSFSYIAKGLGSRESFQSCSHGAGRAMSRTKAKDTVSAQEVMEELKEKGIALGKPNLKDVAEECRQAYKDIDEVIENEKDLVEPVMKLSAIAVIKG